MIPNSVERSMTVRCSITTAFQVFSAQLNQWWPKSHSRSGDPNTTVMIEPWIGGRLYERTQAGVEYVWGQVIIWEPPLRLAYHWYLGSSSEQPSRVAISFTDLGNHQTRVDVFHRGPELIGAIWERNFSIYAASWDHILAAYTAVCVIE